MLTTRRVQRVTGQGLLPVPKKRPARQSLCCPIRRRTPPAGLCAAAGGYRLVYAVDGCGTEQFTTAATSHSCGTATTEQVVQAAALVSLVRLVGGVGS